MAGTSDLALEALRRVRLKSGLLPAGEGRLLERDLARIESALGARRDDPYAIAQGTPADLAADITGGRTQTGGGGGNGNGNGNGTTGGGRATPAPPASSGSSPPASAQIGGRAAAALEAVDFPGFVAALVTGTFQAIVDATGQQVREYATLVASVSRSVEDFSRDNVTANQARDWMASRYPNDLSVALPEAGKAGTPRLIPRAGRTGDAPAWLSEYGLAGQEFNEELTEGPLLEKGRSGVGEERMQTLATMVLLGINRIVVNEGDIRAKMQFHAVGRDQLSAETMAGQAGQGSVATRTIGQPSATTMISTLKANVQSEASIRADLMGEVRISFRSETFPLERFADSQAIQLLNRHAKWKGSPNEAAPAVAARPTVPAPPEPTK